MTESELLNQLARAARVESYDCVRVRELLVDHFREVGFRVFAEKLEAAMQMLNDEPGFEDD